MMDDKQLTCDPGQIERFLGDSLSDGEQAAFESHLDDCVDCRRRLETAAAGEEVWSGVRESLMTDFAEGPAGGDSELDPTADGAAPYCHAALLALLAPSDDERSLGRLGTYEVVGVVGSGGMGVVLKAFDAALDRYVAIKLMAPHLGGSGAARKRFAREARAAAAVVHDNVIEIHGVSDADGLPYLVMPYVRGPSLQRRLDEEGPLETAEILRIGMQAAAGLAAAHAQGLIHRDVSPGNILLEDGVERVKLTDFGLARAADDASLTRSGMIAGTPQYMSPEQARGESLDQRSDLFSLGSVLYAMCTGRPPFRAETSYGVLRRITDEEPRPIREINPDIPEWLCRIVARLMAKDPDKRFPSARGVAELLERCLAHVQQPMAAELPEDLRETASVKGEGRGRTIRRVLAGAAFAFALLLAGVVIVLELNKGTLTIESDADDVPIRVMQGDEVAETLTVTRRGASVRIAAGQYVVEIDGAADGIAIENETVILQRGGREIVKIVKKDASPVVQIIEGDDYSLAPIIRAQKSGKVELRMLEDGRLVIRGSEEDVNRVIQEIKKAGGAMPRVIPMDSRPGVEEAPKADATSPPPPGPGASQTTAEEAQHVRGNAPATEAENAVARLVLVFFGDRSRRAVPAVLVDAGTYTLAVTAGPATIVPDGAPAAIDRAFLELPGRGTLNATFVDDSTAQLAVYRAGRGLTDYRMTERVDLAPGDVLSAIMPGSTPELYVTPDAARVVALERKAELNLPERGIEARYEGLVEIDRALPEGTPVFKDGKLAGLTLLGSRFLEEKKSYVMPIAHIRGFFLRRGVIGLPGIFGAPGGHGAADPPSVPSPAPAENTPGRTRLRVLDAGGKAVADNRVILGRQGYAGANLPELSATPSHRGVISLDDLTAGTHWLMLRGDPPAVFKLVLPAGEGMIVRSPQPRPGLIGKNLDATLSVGAAGESEILVIKIHNRGDEAVSLSELSFDLLTAIEGPEADAHVLSPRWAQGADAPETRIEPGQTVTIGLNWTNWVRNGLWFSRDGEVIAEPAFPESAPGRTSVRIAQFSAPPIGVTHPDRIVVGDDAAAAGLTRRFMIDATGHQTTVACSPDGKRIAVANGNPTRILQTAGTSRVAGEWRPVVEILDAESGESVASLRRTSDEEDAVIAATERITHVEATALAFSRDGKVLAVGTNIGQVKLFDAATGELLRALDHQQPRLAADETPESWRPIPRAMGSVAGLALSPDGELLAVCGETFAEFADVFDGIEELGRSGAGPGRLKVWNIVTGKLQHDLPGHSHVEAVAFSPDRGLLASAGRWDGGGASGSGAIVWNPYAGTIIQKVSIPANGGARSVAISPDSKLTAVASQVFDNANNTSTMTISLAHPLTGVMKWQRTVPGWAKPVAFTPDGKSLVALCSGKSIRFFDVDTGQERHEIRAAEAAGTWTDLAIAPQGETLAIGGVDAEQRCFVNALSLRPAKNVGADAPAPGAPTAPTSPETSSNELQTELRRLQELEAAAGAEKDEAKARDLLRRAAEGYEALSIRHRTQLGGLYARFYKARCLEKLGDDEEAQTIYRELLALPDGAEAIERLKAAVRQSQPAATDRADKTDGGDVRSEEAETALRFSEPTEIVLSMGSIHFMLDLDTGATMDPPARPRPAQQRVMDVRSTQVQPYQYPTGLTGLSLEGVKVKPSDWDASVSQVQGRLAYADAAAPLTEMQYDPAESATWFFRTREGAEGVLQIVGLVEEPKGIRIRYKKIVAAPAAPPRDGD